MQINSHHHGPGRRRPASSDLLDEKPEVDEGKVMLVNAKRLPDDSVTETKERTNLWAWKRVTRGQRKTTVN